MSRDRAEAEWVPYLDDEGRPLVGEDGQRLGMIVESGKAPTGIADIENVDRLVDINCPRGHLVAVVTKSPDRRDRRRLVLLASDTGAAPVLMVHSDGLSPVLGEALEDGQWKYSPMGVPTDSGHLNCHECPQAYVLRLEHIDVQLARPGRKKRMTLADDAHNVR